jgi:hypothetical protein
MKKLVGIDNPIVKITTFADALEKGFSQIPQILKNNGIDISDLKGPEQKERTLAQIISGNTGPAKNIKHTRDPGKDFPMPDLNAPDVNDFTQNEADGDKKPADAQKKLKSIVDQLTKALSPGGIFGAFKKVPYVDSATLAKDLINAPIRVFSNVAKAINSGAKAAEVAQDLKATLTGKGEAQTTHDEKENPVKKTGQTQPGEPTKTSTGTTSATPTGQVPTEGPGKEHGGGTNVKTPSKDALQKIVAAAKVTPKTARDIIDYLSSKGILDIDKFNSH